MDRRYLAIVAVRISGLWLVALHLPMVVWVLVVTVHALVDPPMAEGYGWSIAEQGGSLILFLAGVYLFLGGKDVIDHFQIVPGRCARCGYDLSGAAVRACPECGAEVSPPSTRLPVIAPPPSDRGPGSAPP